MPIAELLGVQLDMQLLLKLSLSVASVLLVSWAYRFYNSRVSHAKACLPSTVEPPPDGGPVETGEPRGETARSRVALKHPSDGRDLHKNRHSLIHSADADDQISDRTGRPPAGDIKQQTEVSTRNVSFDSATLNLPGPGECGPDGAIGHRSPCFLQRLERSVGVGRELRQDVDHQGAHSSFLSKAEIQVEDAHLVLEGTELDQVVRGKIYDYFVESSSHSVTESKPVFGHNARTSSPDSRPEPLSPVTPPELGPPAKPPLLRKESYLSATEHSQFPIPCLAPGASTPGSPSQTSPCEEPHSASPGISSSVMSAAGRRLWQEPGLETLAGAPFVHLPAKRLNSRDLEGLKSKLDLGNCMEVLGLAKLCGDESLKRAALRVMSDNYLQVLREPALYGRLMACERDDIQRHRMRGRRYVMVADMDPRDWAEGPSASEQRRTSSSLYYYDDYKDAWNPLCPIPREVISKGCALCTMDNYLFVAVGCQGTEREMIPSKRVFCFNPVTSIWKEISPMNQARPHCKLAAVRGYVYAIGGECLSTVERYDPRADRWAFVAPLPNDTFAVGHRAAVCNGEIYITGGSLRYALLRYSPDQDAWRPGVVVGSGDQTTDMVAVRSFLYRFEVNPQLGVSAYRYHAVARLWYRCSNARLAGVPSFRCVATEDSVFCVGRRFAVKFTADEISPGFCGEPMTVLSAAKGVLFPFVLSLPDKEPVQTSV
ncbi:unnamed protein product [Lota lota]